MNVSLDQNVCQGRVTGTAIPWQAGATMVTASALMSDADASNPAVTVTFGMEFCFDGTGENFGSAVFSRSTGGINPLTSKPNLPIESSGFSADGASPTHVRVFVDSPAPLSIGGQVTFS